MSREKLSEETVKRLPDRTQATALRISLGP